VSEAEHEARVLVHLTEFSITPQLSSARAGEITFDAANDGQSPHELAVRMSRRPWNFSGGPG
jgi:hypothetical protein